MRKKAQIGSVLSVMLILVVLAITILLGRLILTTFYDAMDEAQLTTDATETAKTTILATYSGLDYTFVFLVVGLILGMIISSFFIPTHPIFILLNIIGIFVLVFLGMIFSNVYGEIIVGEDAILGVEAEGYPIINYVILYLPYLGAVLITIATIIMFSRSV